MERKSGVLMHISSLPGDTGIGTMGDEARKFVDFLSAAHQTYWQILPLCQTSYGDSPYQSYSTFAGNPYFIDLDYLKDDGLLKEKDYKDIDWESDPTTINYEALYHKRFPILRKAVKNFLKRRELKEYKEFEKKNDWLNDYALFMTIKAINNDVGLIDWEKKYRVKDKETIKEVKKKYRSDIKFWKVVQYFFYKQWFELKKYANDKGILIIGDCPIYVANDSCDLWGNPELFEVDENLVPKNVAGVPPDGFTPDGQLWGNPLYLWDVHKKTKYKWWIKRVKHLNEVYDILRIDHFRGLSRYFSVPYGDKTARNGVWVDGPGNPLITAFKKRTNNKIIAEDLGYLDDEVKELLAYSGYPGMALLEFGFDMNDGLNNFNSSFNLKKNQIIYIGTHDSDTCMGWINNLKPDHLKFVKEFINYHDDEEIWWQMIKLLLSTVPDTAIVAAQDLIGLDNSARMNTPGKLGGNWLWRANKGVFTKEIAEKLKHLTHLYSRA